MTFRSDLWDYLRTVLDIVAVFGDPPRIYPVRAPASAALPYIVYRRISEQHVHHMRESDYVGQTGFVGGRYQFDVYGASDVSAEAGAEAFRLAFGGYRGTMGATNVRGVFVQSAFDGVETPPAGDESESVFRQTLELLIWHTQPESSP